MPKLHRAALFVALFTAASGPLAQEHPRQEVPAQHPSATETLSTEHSVTDALEVVPITSKTLHNTRMLRILVPGNYWSPHNRTRRYPVLYLQDGQNLFEKATSSTHIEWEVDETIDHLVGSFQIPPMFVVGIDNAAADRTSEYLAYPDADNPQFQGTNALDLRGTEYSEFLIKEVMPYVEKHYRVARGEANTALGGSQYGADVSLLTAINHPGIFGKLLLESPALGVGSKQLLRDVEKTTQGKLPSKIYIGVGTNESAVPERATQAVQNVKELENILQGKGLGPTRLKVVVQDDAEANETAWAKRLPDALLFLYQAKCLGTCR